MPRRRSSRKAIGRSARQALGLSLTVRAEGISIFLRRRSSLSFSEKSLHIQAMGGIAVARTSRSLSSFGKAMGNSCCSAGGSISSRNQSPSEWSAATSPRAQTSASSSARATPSHDFPQRASSSSGTSMAPRGNSSRLPPKKVQHHAVRSSQTHKVLRPASDYALFSRHGNVIGVIAKSGQPSPGIPRSSMPNRYCAAPMGSTAATPVHLCRKSPITRVNCVRASSATLRLIQ